MRTFVAIELDEACRTALARAVDRLKPLAGRAVRWVRPDAMHLTVKFIGELRPTDLPVAIECMQPPAGRVPPFSIEVGGLAAFPPRGAPRVVHVGVHEPTGALAALHGELEEALREALGVRREGRRFHAHVTLGRVKDVRGCPPVEAMAAEQPEARFGIVEVDSFLLMHSELRPDGPVHTPLHRFALGGAEGGR
ncbi:MAG: RNA 2',3'-cyclic phosphodiesterase [Candidatus Brocadiaceae bacterium]|nr:RNA 2',3'-cyclic phosphodiesterase [Candidatus Brocadiaceae bacterium]